MAALVLRFSAPKLAANRTHALCSNATYSSGRPSVFIAIMREQDIANFDEHFLLRATSQAAVSPILAPA